MTTDCLAQMIRSTTSWFNIIPNETVSIKTGIKHICYGYIYGLEVNVLIVKDFSFRLAKYGGYGTVKQKNETIMNVGYHHKFLVSE